MHGESDRAELPESRGLTGSENWVQDDQYGKWETPRLPSGSGTVDRGEVAIGLMAEVCNRDAGPADIQRATARTSTATMGYQAHSLHATPSSGAERSGRTRIG